MGQVTISETTLARIGHATRTAMSVPSYNIPIGDCRFRDLENVEYDLAHIDTEHMWDWAVNDGGTYLHLVVVDPGYLTVTIFVKITGTLYWGDGSTVETYTDSAATYHTHTYSAIGQYVVKLSGTIVLGTSSHCMTGSEALVQRYLQKIEIGANTTFPSGGINAPQARLIYFSNTSNGCSNYNWQESPFRFMYINKVTVQLPTYGMSGFRGCQLKAIYGDGYIKMEGIHAFRGAAFYTMDHVEVDLATVSSNSRYFNGEGTTCSRLHFKNPLTTAQVAPNRLIGSYYYINFPSNLTAFNDSGSEITILSEGELHCQRTTPPTLRSGSITCQTGSHIYVPVGCLEAYQTASNWSALADYMEEE